MHWKSLIALCTSYRLQSHLHTARGWLTNQLIEQKRKSWIKSQCYEILNLICISYDRGQTYRNSGQFTKNLPFIVCVLENSLHLCLTLCDHMDHSPPGSSVHRILQARILEWVAMRSSRASCWPRYQTLILCLLHWQMDSLTLAPPGKPLLLASKHKSKKVTWLILRLTL